MMLLWMSMAWAGIVFHDGNGSYIYAFNTRTMTSTQLIYGGGAGVNEGMAYDRSTNTIWYGTAYTIWLRYENYYLVDLNTMQSGPSPFVWVTEALAFDPVRGETLSLSASGLRSVATGTILGPGLETFGADWFDDGGYMVATSSLDGNIYDVSTPGGPYFLGDPSPGIPTTIAAPLGMAYDSDTKMFLTFTSNGGVTLMEPENFAVIGAFAFANFYPDAAAGSIDNVPQQMPTLIVSATAGCPGPATVTVVDATPGGHVQVASSRRLGPSTVPAGRCAGTALGLQRPTPRLDLVANRYGIAWTTFDAPAWMCGSLHVQAVDVDSCLATEVGTIDSVILP